jgi:hypothetical protein
VTFGQYPCRKVTGQMAEQTAEPSAPIQVMGLIHKALSAEAGRVQRIIEDYQEGDSLQNFRAAFNFWATALMYHADIEDRYMTLPLTDFEPARTNESEHAQLGGLADGLAEYLNERDEQVLEHHVKAAAIALHEEQHHELLEKLEDVLDVLNGEIGRTRVIARTRRHLYGKVVALRICQDDHLESEEAIVLPEVEARLSLEEQQEVARHLLIDEESEEPTWVLDWVVENVSPPEREFLTSSQNAAARLASPAS